MEYEHLGPNGGLIYCLEYLEKEVGWLTDHIHKLRSEYNYILIDCPGQVELYTHHDSMKNIASYLQSLDIRLCAVHLVDSHHCSDAGKFISISMMSLCAMLMLELPHINVLSKMDLIKQMQHKLPFGMQYYTEVLDLSHLLECLQDDPFTARYGKLNEALTSLIEDYSLVSFHLLDVKNVNTLTAVKDAVDRANGYIFGFEEKTSSLEQMLSSAMSMRKEILEEEELQ